MSAQSGDCLAAEAMEGMEAASSVQGKGRKSGSETTPLTGNEATGGWSIFHFIGPGLLVCLADTDAGCLIVAAQSGARWGYSLLPLQVILIPILFAAQELTIRLAVHTKQGHTACIKQHFGSFWAWFSAILLLFECIAGMISEMSGITAVGELWGLSRGGATLVAGLILVGVVFSCNYKQIEIIGVTLGLCELVFIGTMFAYHPSPTDIIRGSTKFHTDPEYFKLIAANIGAVIMPWMIYFQQSAVVARRITVGPTMQQERAHTMVGSILTQFIMIGALATLAAAHSAARADLETVKDIVDALAPVLGEGTAKVLISLAIFGGSLCAAFVVALAASWALSEAVGTEDQHSLDVSPKEAPFFYGSFLAVVVLGSAILLAGVNVVKLNVIVELLDGMLLPFAVGFLYLLACSDVLPQEARLKGGHKYALGVTFSVVVAVSVGSAVYGLVRG